MIIQCDHCKTRFRLDDSKVTATGVRVRCSRCKHTFVVKKEVLEEDIVANEIMQGWERSSDDAQNELNADGGKTTEETPVARKDEEEKPQEWSSAAAGENLSVVNSTGNSYASEGHVFIAANGGAESAPVTESELNEEGKPVPQWAVESDPEAGHIENVEHFHASGTATGCLTEMPCPESVAFQKASETDNFTNSSCEQAADEGEGVPEISFSDDQPEPDSSQTWEIFSDKADCGVKDDSSLETEVFIDDDMRDNKEDAFFHLGGDANTAHDVSGNTGEFMEGDETNIPERKGQETRESEGFSAFGEAMSNSLSGGDVADVAGEELPPLAITSRRKSSWPISGVLVGLISIVLIAGVAFFYFSDRGFTSFLSPDLSAPAKPLMTGEATDGEIAIKDLNGAFIQNKLDGEFFIVRGEAHNQSTKPRSSFEVQGYIYGGQGEIVMKNPAYLGANLSGEQLANLSLDEIEASMKDKLGKSSQGLVLQPGQGVPFLIVFRDVPQGAGEFGAEVVGSTAVSP